MDETQFRRRYPNALDAQQKVLDCLSRAGVSATWFRPLDYQVTAKTPLVNLDWNFFVSSTKPFTYEWVSTLNADKGPIVSFEMKDAHPHDVATIIDRAGVAVRAGTHCVMPLLARYGVTATCRASFALYNTREEVDALAQALRKAQEFLS